MANFPGIGRDVAKLAWCRRRLNKWINQAERSLQFSAAARRE
jgi:hypothetical protein